MQQQSAGAVTTIPLRSAGAIVGLCDSDRFSVLNGTMNVEL